MNQNKNIIDIYTDGGCSGNPGPGGWGYIIIDSEKIFKNSGADKETTNNKMELIAVIKALENYKNLSSKNDDLKDREVRVFTDSAYVKNGITTWIKTWLKNGWKTADKKDVKNKELWILLKDLSDQINPKWEWVKGHSGDKWNEECDALVKKEIKKIL